MLRIISRNDGAAHRKKDHKVLLFKEASNPYLILICRSCLPIVREMLIEMFGITRGKYFLDNHCRVIFSKLFVELLFSYFATN